MKVSVYKSVGKVALLAAIMLVSLGDIAYANPSFDAELVVTREDGASSAETLFLGQSEDVTLTWSAKGAKYCDILSQQDSRSKDVVVAEKVGSAGSVSHTVLFTGSDTITFAVNCYKKNARFAPASAQVDVKYSGLAEVQIVSVLALAESFGASDLLLEELEIALREGIIADLAPSSFSWLEVVAIQDLLIAFDTPLFIYVAVHGVIYY